MNNKGFTLIEIIIVIVILGIMASLALPKITSTIDRGRIPAALETIGKVVREMDTCAQTADNVENCDTAAELGYTVNEANPNGVPSVSGWDFVIAGADPAITITATCGDCTPADSSVVFTVNLTAGDDGGAEITARTASGSLQGFHFRQ